ERPRKFSLRFCVDATQCQQGPARTTQDGQDGQRREEIHMSNPVAPASLAHLYQGYEPKLLTAADLAALPSDLPSGTVRYELDHGVLVIMPPPGDIHGAVESNLSYHLKGQGELRGHGKARSGDVGIVLARNPDHVDGADVVFITNARLPIQRTPEGYLETIP